MEFEKKRILYVITKSNFGGAQRYVFELAVAARTQGFDVAVAFGGNGSLKDMLDVEGIHTFAIPSFKRDINLRKEFFSMFELRDIIHTFKPDIVHLNSSKAGGTGALIARCSGVKKIIFTAHGWPFFEDRSFAIRSIIWLLSYITALLSHHVILVSYHDENKTWMPYTKKRQTVIHTGVPHIMFKDHTEARNLLFSKKELSDHGDDLWLVTVSEHTKNKNLFMLLDALEVHNSKEKNKIFLTLMSDGEEHNALVTYAQKLNLGSYIHFTGHVSDARSYLKAFDVLALPSRKEGLPYVLLEAGMAELPVIASNVGGIPEVVQNETSGLLIDPYNTQTVVVALGRYTESQILRKSHGRALHERVIRDFSLKEMLEKTIAVYQQ